MVYMKPSKANTCCVTAALFYFYFILCHQAHGPLKPIPLDGDMGIHASFHIKNLYIKISLFKYNNSISKETIS